MKHHVRRLTCSAALLAAILAAGCGGRQTMASRSAAAFDEAKRKGIPIATGEHGGHSTEAGIKAPAAATTGTDQAPAATSTAGRPPMSGMDHATPPAAHDAMPGMNHAPATKTTAGHGPVSAMDPAKMPGMKHGSASAIAREGVQDMAGMDHSAMDHSRMPGMQHGSSAVGVHERAGMDHASMAGMDHSTMTGIDHAANPGMDHATIPGMQHGGPTPSPAPIAIAQLASSAAITQVQPAATLRPDAFDAPAQDAVDEAAKAAGGSHSMDGGAPPRHEHQPPAPPPPSPPPPPSGHPHHGNGEAA